MQMQTLQYYLREYDRFTEEFLSTFARFDKRRFNAPLAPGRWSPGQLVAHLNLSERATLKLLAGPTEVEPDRTADAKCADILARWAPTTERFPAPANLSPREEVYPLVETLDTFVDQRADVRSAADFAADPAAVVTGWSHPLFGALTVLEWMYFTAVHGERHRRQYGDFARAGVDETTQFAPRARLGERE